MSAPPNTAAHRRLRFPEESRTPLGKKRSLNPQYLRPFAVLLIEGSRRRFPYE
jgi:hypothetical protein